MKNKEFYAKCRELNAAYYNIFNEIPCIQDYSCSREEFIAAINQAIKMETRIDKILTKNISPKNPNVLI